MYVAKRRAKPSVKAFGSNNFFASLIIFNGVPDLASCLPSRLRGKFNKTFANQSTELPRSSSEMFRTLFSIVSIVPSQRSFPQATVQSLSAAAESQVGICTPFVTDVTGTSSWGQFGKEVERFAGLPCREAGLLRLPLRSLS